MMIFLPPLHGWLFSLIQHLGCEQQESYDLGTNFLHQLGLVMDLADCHIFSWFSVSSFPAGPMIMAVAKANNNRI